MTSIKFSLFTLRACAVMLSLTIAGGAVAAAETPETVVITYQVRPGAEQALAAVIARHWKVARRMKLVRSSPSHLVLQGGGVGQRCIIEILTWSDGSIPDTAPAEITSIWQEMEQLVEARDGRPGIDISQVQPLDR